MERTIRIPQSIGTTLKAKVVTSIECPHCGQHRTGPGLTDYYRQLGEEAAAVLYAGTPSTFWQAIADFAIDHALREGRVQRPLKAEDITRQW